MLSIAFATSPTKTASKQSSAIAVLVADDGNLPASSGLGALESYLTHAISAAQFKGKKGETLVLVNPNKSPSHLIIAGIGAAKSATTLTFEEVGGAIVAAALTVKLSRVEVLTALPKAVAIKADEAAAHLAFGGQLRSYRFDKYRTKMKADDKPSLTALTVISASPDKAKKQYAPLGGIADSIAFARDLVTEPSNILYPVSYAAEIKKLEKLGIKVEVLGEAAMKKLGMGSLLGVGQGSVRESQLVVMQYYGGKKGGKPVALVGKGVTFDTGGISIKPANGMEDMKYDMGGSATVVGTMRALAARAAKVNVIGVVGLVENMPDGNAQRPGDVVTSMSGQTIEVLNTDAEGRLVLADALWYTQDRFKPQCMLDLATLTGSIVVALGSGRAGMFSNSDKMCDALMKAAARTGENLWRMPMGPEYDEMINCDIADMKNISDGREAGSTTAAQFLQRFVNDVPWVHLDIAGVAWAKKATHLTPKGAVGWGIRLLNDWIANEYE